MTTSTPPREPGTIVVVGSLNVDLVATVHRHPRPGETVHGSGGGMSPGGKGANQALAAAQLGGRVRMVGAVGSDARAEVALSSLRASGAELSAIAEVEGPTGLAIVTVAEDGENSIVVIAGANASVDATQVRRHAAVIGEAAIVVCQGEIPRDGIEALPALVRGRFLHNPAPVTTLDPEVLRASDPLVVNEHEAALVLAQLGTEDVAGGNAEHIAGQGAEGAAGQGAENAAGRRGKAVVESLRGTGIRSVVLTLGARGALVSDAEGVHRIPPARVDAVDTTGAGDAFIGALALGLARGETLAQAARLASRVGAFAATGAGAQPSFPTSGDPLPELVEDTPSE